MSNVISAFSHPFSSDPQQKWTNRMNEWMNGYENETRNFSEISICTKRFHFDVDRTLRCKNCINLANLISDIVCAWWWWNLRKVEEKCSISIANQTALVEMRLKSWKIMQATHKHKTKTKIERKRIFSYTDVSTNQYELLCARLNVVAIKFIILSVAFFRSLLLVFISFHFTTLFWPDR